MQALHLANDPVFLEIAEQLARRVIQEGPADNLGRIDLAFQFCLARLPIPEERQRLQTYLAEQQVANAETSWSRIARALLNLDEFVTRE